MNGRTQDRTNDGTAIVALSLWITAAAIAAWMVLWFLTGNFVSSVLSILAALTFLAIWSSEKSFFIRKKEEALATAQPAPLEG